MKHPEHTHLPCEGNPTAEKYLACRSAHKNWMLEGASTSKSIECVVVIPVLAEFDRLFVTLDALARASEAARAVTLIICVVNNCAAGIAPTSDVENNQATLARLRVCAQEDRYAPLMLAVVDASSESVTLPPGEGVGLARKIGLDHGLYLLASAGRLDAPLVCLDGDSPPAAGYLDAILDFYGQGNRWAGYAAYRHVFPESEEERNAIIAYEIFMRYHEIGLHVAGSPYAYPALGSIISCTGKAYAACGGMNRRLAGEDFYFMQQLTKTGIMEPVPYALVCPAGRSSCRTPFGTGRSVMAFGNCSPLDAPLYHPDCYDLLRAFFHMINGRLGHAGSSLMEVSETLHPALARFLKERRFEEAWDGMLLRYRNPAQRLHQFHVWFDGLRTIQLFHRLQESGFPDLPAREAIPVLFHGRFGGKHSMEDMTAEEVLEFFREIGLRRHVLPALPLPPYCPDAFRHLAPAE